MDMANLTTILSSFAVGVVAAVLLKSRSRWLAVGAKMGFRDMKMVLIVRSDLEVGRNKAAIHCSHAAIGCYKRALTAAPSELKKWEREGQTKVVLKIPGEADMLALAQSAQNTGLVAVLIHDNTPQQSNVPTVLGIGPGPAKLVDKVAGHLKLF